MQLNCEDFNEMSYTGICNLPGIGKKVAERIVAMQPFRTNNDLFKIKGLGYNTLRNLGIEKVNRHIFFTGLFICFYRGKAAF